VTSFQQEANRLVGRLERIHARERQGIERQYEGYRQDFVQLCEDGRSEIAAIRSEMEEWQESGRRRAKDDARVVEEELLVARELRAEFQSQFGSLA
jgi:hypothetical protein